MLVICINALLACPAAARNARASVAGSFLAFGGELREGEAPSLSPTFSERQRRGRESAKGLLLSPKVEDLTVSNGFRTVLGFGLGV